MKKMKAMRLHEIGDLRTDNVPIPEPQGEELLVKVHRCGVCGSDIPRAYQLGTSFQKYPLTIGHEFAGEVVAVGPQADPNLVGDRGAIFPLIPCRSCDACLRGDYVMCSNYDYMGSRCDGGFAEYCVVPSSWHLVEARSSEISYDALAMTEPATVAQHALRRAGVAAGDFIVIFGAGPIGIMASRWCRIFGASKVLLVDILAEKVEYAAGKTDAVTALATDDLEEIIRRNNRGRLADIVIEGTGSGAALNQGINCVRAGGNIALMGNPNRDTVLSLKNHSQILRKELNLFGIWNSSYCDAKRNEWRYTVEKMELGELVVEDLITHRADLDNLPALMKQIHDGTANGCKAMCECANIYE